MTSPYLLRPIRTMEQAEIDKRLAHFREFGKWLSGKPSAYAPDTAGCPKLWPSDDA